MSDRLELQMGALAPQIHEQLKRPKQEMKRHQACADAITRLLIHGILSSAEGHRARQRLVKKIANDVVKAGQSA